MDIIGPTPKVLESEGCDGGPEICMCLKPAFPLMVMCTQVWEPLSLDTVGKLRLLQTLVDSGICIGFLAQHPWSEKWKWKIWNFCQYWHDAKRNVKVLGVWVLRLGMLSLFKKHGCIASPGAGMPVAVSQAQLLAENAPSAVSSHNGSFQTQGLSGGFLKIFGTN